MESPASAVNEIVQHFSADDIANMQHLVDSEQRFCEDIQTSAEMQRLYYSNSNDVVELQNLLASWNLSDLFDYFEKQQLYVGVLKHFPDQLAGKLFEGTKFSFGMQGEFIHHWSNWKRQSLGQPVSAIALQSSDTTPKTIMAEYKNSVPQMVVQSLRTINLRNITSSGSPYGQIICSHHEKHGELDERTRKLLVEAFLQYCISNNIDNVSKSDCKNLAQEIVATFPGEAMGYYYVERPGAPLGKLYSKYHNWKSCKIAKSSEPKAKTAKKSGQQSLYLETDGEQENIRSLCFDNLSFNDRMDRWKGCVATRLNVINNVSLLKKSMFESWPQYKEPYGYKLLESDFNFLFGEKNEFLDQNEEFIKIMLSDVLPRGLKNAADVDLLREVTAKKEKLHRNAICAAVFRLVQSLLPNGKAIKMLSDSSNSNRKRKCQQNFSIDESRDAFIVVCATDALYKEYFDLKVSKESSVPPYITIIGTLLTPDAILVDFENITYKMDSLPKAIDVCFKAYNLFRWEYSPAARLMWQFINKQFYELPDVSPNPVVHILVKNIKGNLIALAQIYSQIK